MPGRFLSPALKDYDITSFLTVPLTGVEAEIYNSIWNAVIDRAIPSGAKLDEASLSDIFGVSRTITRRVLVVMEQDGIVALPPNRGAFIASPTRQEGLDVLDAVRVLYIHFAEKLAANPENLSQRERDRLEAHLSAESLAYAENDLQRARRIRGELGTLLGVLTGNMVLSATMAKYMIRGIIALALYQTVSLPDTHLVGRAICDSIYRGDAKGARAMINKYSDALIQSIKLKDTEKQLNLRSILRRF